MNTTTKYDNLGGERDKLQSTKRDTQTPLMTEWRLKTASLGVLTSGIHL